MSIPYLVSMWQDTSSGYTLPYRLTAYTPTTLGTNTGATATITNPTYAYDSAGISTYAQISTHTASTAITTPSVQVIYTTVGYPGGTYTGHLYCNCTGTISGGGAGGLLFIGYSLNGGSTFTWWIAQSNSSAWANQTFSAVLTNQDLSQVQVFVYSYSADDGSLQVNCNVLVYDIYINT